MKKMISIFFLIFIIACSKSDQVLEEKVDTEFMLQDGPSDFKIKACSSADKHNSCNKLDSLGLISPEECCSELSKCC